ncbi:tissue factor pathway inhibitor [Caerostris darwini]|uniref:Tissue factor pathway inhibitor n=1 Tax=Caerostris darwini TaxID=1538125 RepID=A0AAV4Q1V7_9ARAC|nr:tissue factor pathway inhibitor [Caerostris darwini]
MKTAIVVFLFVAVFSCAYSASFPYNPAQPNYDNIPRCMQPPATGLCLAYFPSFYYNPATKKCESFIYGGCQGNQNRFINEEQCMKACGERSG